MELPAGDCGGLVGPALDVEFDAALLFVVEGDVREAVDLEIAAEFAVDPLDQVEVEGGVGAGAVVVGGVEDLGFLLQVDADQHLAAGPQQFAAVAKKANDRIRLEIADRRAGEETDALSGRTGQWRQLE